VSLFLIFNARAEVRPEINTWVRKDQLIAVVKNIFGDIIKKYYSPEDGTKSPLVMSLTSVATSDMM
jgi:hypothetical protein